MKLVQTGWLAALLMASASVASGATLTVGLQEAGTNGGAITNEGSSVASIFQPAMASGYGTFSEIAITADQGAVPGRLFTDSIDTAASTPGTLNIYLTESGITSLLGVDNFLSSFTANLLPDGWIVTEATYLDTGNGIFTTSDQLASVTFAAAAVSTNMETTADTGAGPYSVTEVYTVTATTGTYSSNNTINLTTTVPEPGTIAILGAGLIGLGFFRQRRSSSRG